MLAAALRTRPTGMPYFTYKVPSLGTISMGRPTSCARSLQFFLGNFHLGGALTGTQCSGNKSAHKHAQGTKVWI